MQWFFQYLDKFFVKHHQKPALLESGLSCFKTEVFDRVKGNVTKEILILIEKERNGESVDGTLLQRCIEVYRAMEIKDMQVYNTDFEELFLQESVDFYGRKAQEWITTDSTSEYLFKTETAIESESTRVSSYLMSSTNEKIRKLCADTMLKTQEQILLEKENSGMKVLLRDLKKDDLARVYRMFLQVEQGLEPVAKMVQQHITQEGKVILDKREVELMNLEGKESSAHDAAFVENLLELHEKYQSLVRDQFQNNSTFQKALKYAFESTVNTDFGKHSNAELLSTHADSVLKTGGDEKLTESQIEDVLEKVVSLFSFLSDKDVFVDVYRNHLAKRLLNGRSASPFAERSMIQKLKLKCGAHFTSKLEGMLTDLSLGKDMQTKFASYIEVPGNEKPPTEFSCEVLTTGHWPSYKILEPILPPVFAKCVDIYQSFYAANTNNRKLTWVHSLGTATVKGSFKVSYDFQVTTLQALALLIFNDVPSEKSLTFTEINQRLGNLEAEITKRILHSLACQKVHVLVKEPDSKKIEETDTFKVYHDFQSKIRKVRIPMASLEETHNPKRVEEDRGLAVEAAIVRIMKARKRLQHTLLVSEVVNQLRTFKPDPKLIKKKIEHLIERDYLERDDTEHNFYKYLA